MATDTLPELGFFDKHRDKIAFAGPDDCWLWTAATNPDGYGKVKVCGRARLASREAYKAIHGIGSADGLVVRHKCDNPACVYPAHLELGTKADNSRDMTERDRQAKGEACSWAKLIEVDVRCILAVYVPRCRINGGRALAQRFRVSRSVISEVVNRKIWRHVA